jgi:transcriptional regulator with XRE-family HTH domain
MTPSQTRVAKEVQRRITIAGISFRDLATTTGIPRATLSRRLNGMKAFDLDELDKIASVLGTTSLEIQSTAANNGIQR